MKILITLIAAISLYSQNVFAHANLMANGSIPPRNTIANKTAPCGIARAAGQAKTMLQPGQQLTISFQETIDHPGYYQIWFSPNADDSNMVLLKDNIPDVQGGTLPHQYTTTVTVPNTPCTDCTIRMIQVMLENPAVPSNYYSCANVAIAGTASTPVPAPSPSPTAPVATPPSSPANCAK